jgi:sugar phosphate isomerase/epimerase
VSSPQNPLWDEPGLAEVKGLQSRYGLEVPSLCLQGYTPLDFRHREEETRRKGIEFVRHAVEVIAALSGNVLLLPFFSQEYPLRAEDVTDQRLIEGFKACAPIAEKLGVYLAIECLLDAKNLKRLLRSIGSPAVGVYYDVGNATSMGYDAAAEIRELGRYVAQVHVKETPSGKPLGDGRVNYPAVAKALKDVGYDGYLIVEMPVETPEDLAKHLAFVQRTFRLEKRKS